MARSASTKLPLSRREWVFVGLILAAALAAYLALASVAFDFSIDDTFISMRYSHNLARHGQLAWNLDENPHVEGYTTLIWVLLGALIEVLIPHNPFLGMKLLSLLFGAAAMLVSFDIGRRLFRHWLPAALPTLLLALTPAIILWGVSGMETTFYVFLVLLALDLGLMEEADDLRFVTPVLLFLVALTRTEGIVFYAAFIGVRLFEWLIYHEGRYALRRKRWLAWNAVFLALMASYLLWKWRYYGSLIPLPVYIKTASGGEGIEYVKRFLRGYYPFLLLAVVGFVRAPRRRAYLYLFAFLGAYFAALSAANPIVGLHSRLILAAVPLIFLLAVFEVDDLLQARVAGWLERAALTGLVLAMIWLITSSPRQYVRALRADAAREWLVLKNVHVAMGEWLRASVPEGLRATVALGDAGATVYYSELDAIDLLGLNDVRIARQGFDLDDLLDRGPEFIVLKSRSADSFQGSRSVYGEISDALYEDARFQAQYTLVQPFSYEEPFYSLWLFRRADFLAEALP